MKHRILSAQDGFTLVELAIALMVIGLLIGGVLKGQELIENARIVATTKQLSDYSTASLIFQSTYGFLPGDIKNPSSRLGNCTVSPCNVGGDGNSQIGQLYSTGSTYLFSFENNSFWSHLYAAGLVRNIGEDTGYSASTPNLGFYPELPMGGRIDLRYYERPVFGVMEDPIQGHTFILLNNSASFSSGIIGLPTRKIARIDHKIDDGKPWSGKVLLGSTTCATTSTYDKSDTVCSAFFVSQF